MKNQAFPSINPLKNVSNAGNALVICLIVIALLGALTAMLARSSGRVTNNYSSEQIRVAVGKFLRGAQDVESGVSRLVTINGCGENAIDFTNTYTTKSYAHVPVSADNNCMLYKPEGAGLAYNPPSPVILDTSQSSKVDYGQLVFLGRQCVLKIGTGDGSTPCAKENLELMLLVRYLSPEACLEINRSLNIPDAGTSDKLPVAGSDVSVTGGYKGNFVMGSPTEIGSLSGNGLNLTGRSSGCFNDTSGGTVVTYTFYHILLAR